MCDIVQPWEGEGKKKGTNVPDGMLKKLVLEEEEKAGLTSNFISLDTIRSRVKRHNVTAYNPFEEPLIAKIGSILWDICIQLGKMSQPLTKTTIKEFASSLLAKMEH